MILGVLKGKTRSEFDSFAAISLIGFLAGNLRTPSSKKSLFIPAYLLKNRRRKSCA